MNCQELKEQLLEQDNLESLEGLVQESSVAAHLAKCSSCRASLNYEIKLRTGFERMTEEPVPANIFNQIMDIQKNDKVDSLLSGLLNYFKKAMVSAQFRIAAFACLTGFFLGVLLMRSNDAIPVGAPIKSRQQIAVQKEALSMPAEKEEASSDSFQIASRESALKKAENLKLSVKEIPADSDDMIPGAVSFSLAEEHEAQSNEMIAEPKAEKRPMLAMAPALRRNASIKPSKPKMQGESMKKSRLALDSREKSESGIEDKQNILSADDENALRGREIEQLLVQHDIAITGGVLDLESLALRGFLSSSQFKRLKPRPGYVWFVEIQENGTKVFLKKR